MENAVGNYYSISLNNNFFSSVILKSLKFQMHFRNLFIKAEAVNTAAELHYWVLYKISRRRIRVFGIDNIHEEKIIDLNKT